MDIEQALVMIDAVLRPGGLSDIQELLLRQCWLGKSYYEIAEEFGYDAGYLRVVGSRLWKDLSLVLGEKITKNNLRSILRQLILFKAQSDKSEEKQQYKRIKAAESLLSHQLFTSEHPLAVAEFPGSQVSGDSPFYVERPPIESRCCSKVLQPGALIRIKAPKQMGKTSLLGRIVKFATNRSYSTVYLSLQQADQEALGNLNHFLRWLCKSISWKLHLEPRLEEYWDRDPGLAKYSCTRYFEEYLLPQLRNPLVLGLDDLDRVFSYPQLAQDFLPLLRVWHEGSKESEVWQQLRLVVVHSTEVYLPLQIHQSPFNVGLPILLPEWNLEQVKALAKQYGLNWENSEAEQLMEMVGGHPYLIQLALYHLQDRRISLAQLLKDAPTTAGIYSNHLRRHLEYLHVASELSAVMAEVVSSNRPVLLNSVLAYQLQSVGLIKLDGNSATPSCQLYSQYFSTMLSTSLKG